MRRPARGKAPPLGPFTMVIRRQKRYGRRYLGAPTLPSPRGGGKLTPILPRRGREISSHPPPEGEGLPAAERLYSITEAAQKLGVSPATIATWIRLGIATASRQDELGRNRYTEADLIEMHRRFQERQARKRTARP